jgi:hypothetical protein
MRNVIIDVSLSVLSQALCLPEGVAIDAAEYDFRRPSNIKLRLAGVGLPEKYETPIDGVIRQASPTIFRDSVENKVVWNWDTV